MCTVSWFREGNGYQVFCNRDERRSRGPAHAPSIVESGGIRQIYPVDPEGGGSWVGVNEYGVSLCLLNHYPANFRDPGETGISRGLLLIALLEARSLAEVISRVAGAQLSRYRQPLSRGMARRWRTKSRGRSRS